MINIRFRSTNLVVAFIIMCVLLLLPSESYGASSFKDIKGHWSERYIEQAVKQGIIKGYPDGKFLPDEKVSRAEFVSMVNRALSNTIVDNINFNDIRRDAWYYNDVSKAVSAGFVSGFDDGSFRPDHKITRQEAAVMLARFLPVTGHESDLKKFKDSREVAQWAYRAIAKVNGKGYISGYTDGRLHPMDSLTRAQAAKIISEIILQETIVTTDPVIKKNGTKVSGRIFSNNVTVHKDLGDGSVSFDNCVILGKLIIQGGGDSTITLNNSKIVEARVNRTDDPVRLLLKGETVISNTVCYGKYALQTSRLAGGSFGSGFELISLTSASSGTFQGDFNRVVVDGSSAELRLLAGNISNLDINAVARRATIFVDSRASINQVNVRSESAFRGIGTITNMQIYAKGVTYETKPKKWTIYSGGDTPSHVNPELAVTFDPAKGNTNVYIDTKISITFNSPMKDRDGRTIANSHISDIVTIRKDTDSGSKVSYSGSINSAKNVMTLTPTSPLDEKTKYYIVIKAGTMTDQNGDRNKEVSSYFTTGNNSEKLIVKYNPRDGETNVPVDKRSFTISFSEGVIKSNGSTITAEDSYLKSNVVLFQSKRTNINTSNYNVAINSKKDLITITLKDGFNLSTGTNYRIGINSSYLKTQGKGNVPSSFAEWITAGSPALSDISTVPYELDVDLKFTPNVNGTVYAVLLNEGAAIPSEAQIREGKDSTGISAIAARSMSVTASKPSTLKISGESIKRDTAYKVFAVLYDGSGNKSTIANLSVRTEPLKLKSLKVLSDQGNELTGFVPDKSDYKVIVPYGTTSVGIIAEAGTTFIGSLTINDQKGSNAVVPIVNGRADITVSVHEDGKQRSAVYKIEVKQGGTAALESMTIEGATYNPDLNEKFYLGDRNSVNIVINPVENDAKIIIREQTKNKGELIELNLDSSTITEKFIIESSDGITKKEYTIKFDRGSLPEEVTENTTI